MAEASSQQGGDEARDDHWLLGRLSVTRDSHAQPGKIAAALKLEAGQGAANEVGN